MRCCATAPATPSTRCSASRRWQPGILSDEISGGRDWSCRLVSTCSSAAASPSSPSPDWVDAVAVARPGAEEHGFPPTAQAPSIVWPDDRAWVLVTEVDYDSTVVGRQRCAGPCARRGPAARGRGDPGRRRPLVGRRRGERMSQAAPPGLTFDARPLVDPVDRFAARDYAKDPPPVGRLPFVLRTGSGDLRRVVFGGVIVVGLLSVFITFDRRRPHPTSRGSSLRRLVGIPTLVPSS